MPQFGTSLSLIQICTVYCRRILRTAVLGHFLNRSGWLLWFFKGFWVLAVTPCTSPHGDSQPGTCPRIAPRPPAPPV